jgi:CheY-like chemotaxis protein
MFGSLILLVEDDPTLREIYRQALSSQGHTVAVAADGEAAISMLYRHMPRMMILDIMLPRMSGIEVCRRARVILQRPIPILFLTSADNIETFRACLEAGGDDFLLKAGSVASILERVNHWIANRHRGLPQTKRRQVIGEVDAARDQPAARPARAIGHAGIASSARPGRPPGVQKPGGTRAIAQGIEDAKLAFDQIRRFVARAYSLAPTDFGATQEQRLYFLGYVTDVINHWAQASLTLKVRFLDGLRDVTREVGPLAPAETQKLLDRWDEVSKHNSFRAACDAADRDCRSPAVELDDYVPQGIAAYGV